MDGESVEQKQKVDSRIFLTPRHFLVDDGSRKISTSSEREGEAFPTRE